MEYCDAGRAIYASLVRLPSFTLTDDLACARHVIGVPLRTAVDKSAVTTSAVCVCDCGGEQKRLLVRLLIGSCSSAAVLLLLRYDDDEEEEDEYDPHIKSEANRMMITEASAQKRIMTIYCSDDNV